MGICGGKDKTLENPNTKNANANVGTTDTDVKLSESKDESKSDGVGLSLGLEIMKQGFVKIDHFEKIYRLKPKFEGSPNLRQAYRFNVFGTGQPNKSSILNIFKTFDTKSSINACMWINMRSEPVIYVKDSSFGPRDPKHNKENIHFSDKLTVDDGIKLEDMLVSTIKNNIINNNNVFEYHKDTYAPLPADRKDIVLSYECNDVDNNVFGVTGLYNNINDANIKCVFERITVADERAPSDRDIDKLYDKINAFIDEYWIRNDDSDSQIDPNVAFVFNCQMGKGRTTEGMIICAMIMLGRGVVNAPNDDIDTDAEWPIKSFVDSEEDDSFMKKIKKNMSETEYKEWETNVSNGNLSLDEMKNGEYTIIKDLIQSLNDIKLNGNKIKTDVDDIINKCAHLQNMRECVLLTKKRYYAENRLNQRGYWDKLSKQYLERYYVLILFNAYLNDLNNPRYNNNSKRITYQKWIETNKSLQLNISKLNQFNWN